MTAENLQQQIDTILARATAAQNKAADPDQSVWVSANAGTGKTRVLTNRILRLLLGGARVTDILAVTYTRTAAQEMRNRVFETLSQWAVISGSALDEAISKTGISRPSQHQRDRARQLFATLLDQPVGLRIETVHAFSQSVLRRFPVEAGIQPYFDLATDTQQAMLKRETATGLLRSTDPLLMDALAAVARRFGVEQMLDYADRLKSWPELLAAFGKDPVSVRKKLFETLGCGDAAADPAAATKRRLIAAFDIDDRRRGDLLRVVAAMKDHGKTTDQKKAAAIAVLLDETLTPDLARLDQAAGGFLKADGELFAQMVTKDVAAAFPEAEAIMCAEADRLQAIYQGLHSIDTASQSFHLIVIAAAMLRAYAEAKSRAGLMDYDDLIETTRALLNADGGAAWVRYKLDRGINHLLIDEAQDTSPRQWQILTALASEFFTSDDEPEKPQRSLFSVGDYKQSIYSFQGARPDLFDRQEALFRGLAQQVRKPFSRVDLETSFRSTAPVLDLVGRVTSRFDNGGIPALPGLGQVAAHEVFRLGQGGFVELMDAVCQSDLNENAAAEEPPADARTVLAGQLVRVLKSWIGKKPLPSRGRMMKAGDILILVRDRQKGGLYHLLDRELRRGGIPVAGADTIKLNDDIAVRDLLALGRAVLLPEDDLTLATSLKSPLFGLSEDDLFRLAHNRGGTRLFSRLAECADHDPVFAAAHEKLTGYLELAENRSPHGFYNTVLESETRRAFARRMGNHVSDVLAEFLESARQFEMVNPSSLLGFIEHFVSSGAEVRRESETRARDEVRIMTIHGAKGLESPVVLLPDALRKDPRGEPIIAFANDDEMPVLQMPGRCIAPQIVASRKSAADKQRAEEDRLFYVAMTRAEDGLLVAGFEDSRRRKRDGSQYAFIEAALMADDPERGILAAERITDENGIGFLRLESAQAVAPQQEEQPPGEDEKHPLPPWVSEPAPAEDSPPKPLSPSRFGAGGVSGSPVGDDRKKAMERGVLTHRLLEILPRLDTATRRAAAMRSLDAGRHHLTQPEGEAILARVLELITAPDLAQYFGDDARAEVPISGLVGATVVSGVIDRLVVGENVITMIDFKTGTPPQSGDNPHGDYISQMALYRHLGGLIWPQWRVEAGLLYTEDASLHWIKADAMDAAIAALTQ